MVMRKRIRSPSYPSWPLNKAVDAVEKIYEVYRTSPVEREAAAKLIGFSTLSGPAAAALGAIRSYGLMALAGKGTSVVTKRAQTILFADDEKERLENLIEAAYSPPIFQKIRETFADLDVPPRDGVIRFLNREELSQVGVKAAARSYIGTANFIQEEKRKVSESSGITFEEGAELQSLAGDSIDKEATEARIGDFVQWESQGVRQFPEPRRVRHVAEDGDWVFVEGSKTGIKMNEVTVVESSKQRVAPPTLPLSVGAVHKNENEWMHNRVGKNTSVRLMVSGDMGPKEVKRLIRMLETQHEVLVEDEELQ